MKYKVSILKNLKWKSATKKLFKTIADAKQFAYSLKKNFQITEVK